MTFVVRLVGGDGSLLAWSRVQTRVRREGATASICAAGSTRFLITQSGTAMRVSIEWPDLCGLARVEPITPVSVDAGQSFDFTWSAPLWRIEGHADAPTPAVTEHGPVVITVPTGSMFAVGGR